MPDQPLKICKLLPIWRCAILGVLFALTPSLLAQAKVTQSSSPQAAQSAVAQVQVLTSKVAYLEQRLAALEQKVAVDEASGLNNPQPATTVGGEEPPSAPGAPSGGMSKSDQARLATLEQQVNQLQQQQQSGETRSVSHPNRVVAPFQVVSTSGKVLMSVEDWKSGTAGGMKVYAPNGGYVQVGPGVAGWSAVRVFSAPGNLQVMMGLETATLPGMSIMSTGGKDYVHISEAGDNGEVDLSNSSGQVVAIIGANPTNGEGHADFMDTAGVPLAVMGAAGDHGDVVLYGQGGKRIPVWEFAFVAPIF
jgi:BMFP domain-containing protein YqiC